MNLANIKIIKTHNKAVDCQPVDQKGGSTMEKVRQAISTSALNLSKHPSFLEWQKSQSIAKDDLVLVNNSFVYRDVKTTKSKRYMAFRATGESKLSISPFIVTSSLQILDLKLLKAKSGNLPKLLSMAHAANEEIHNIGSLIFILIGKVEDNVVLRTNLGHSAFDELVWDPSVKHNAQIDGRKVVVRDTYDEEAIFTEVVSHYQTRGEEIPGGLREAIGVAIDNLQDQAVANLKLPSGVLPSGTNMTDDIVKVLLEQKESYDKALEKCEGDPSKDAASYNEILRISYNFASDASTLLRLIVSICDLKPIVLWGTISEHYSLSEAFRNLPWTRSRKKPSLNNYISTIGDARNSAFHDLFPFRKSLNVQMPDTALLNPSLRFFSEYSRKSENQLIYKDRELVDILLAFTRARDRRAPSLFWLNNAQVMKAVITLCRSTGNFLKLLFSATNI